MNGYICNIGGAKVVFYDDDVPSCTEGVKCNLLNFYRVVGLVYGSFDNAFDYFYTLDEVACLEGNGYKLIR